MALFNFEEKESKGSPLFATALAGGAIGATPLAGYVADNYLVPSRERLSREIADEVKLHNDDIVKKLTGEMLDRGNRKIPILARVDFTEGFSPVGKNYLPRKEDFFGALKKGGYRILGEVDKLHPLRAVERARDVGGFITARPTTDIATLAHELGHATQLNKGQGFRASKLFDIIEGLSRKTVVGGNAPRTAGLLALAGLSLDSENDAKYLLPAVAVATQAPVLMEEGKASIEAMKGLKNLVSKNKNIISKDTMSKAAPMLRRAFGTYGLRSAGILAAPLLAMKARKKMEEYLKD
tara:strand:- start:61956 stop:62840 length:885 start_codon:yes stop_codon:yes gene_type:complete